MLHVDECTIRFAWTVDGVESTVQFELAEDEGGTLVTLSQNDLPSFAEVLADTAAHRDAERVRSRQPAVPGLGRLAGRSCRAAALPRTPAVALDLRQIEIAGVPEGMFSIEE